MEITRVLERRCISWRSYLDETRKELKQIPVGGRQKIRYFNSHNNNRHLFRSTEMA